MIIRDEFAESNDTERIATELAGEQEDCTSEHFPFLEEIETMTTCKIGCVY